jgi:hypothetical protein
MENAGVDEMRALIEKRMADLVHKLPPKLPG